MLRNKPRISYGWARIMCGGLHDKGCDTQPNACLDTVTRPSACLDMLTRPSACLDTIPSVTSFIMEASTQDPSTTIAYSKVYSLAYS